MIKQLWLLSLLMTGSGPLQDSATINPQTASLTESGSPLNVSMIVFSDPHYYHPSLGTQGAAFQHYIDQDRKLLKESAELMEKAVQMTLNSDAEIVLVPGDLTKDGTLISHLAIADRLAYLEEQGIEVFVVPGNHDISNGESYAYVGDSTLRVENVDPVGFEQIYAPFGYDQAFSRDSFSLSYVAEPVEDLWIIGLDPCLYDFNDPLGHAETDGEFEDGTLRWLAEVLNSPGARGKTRIAMMHHGVVEHHGGQEKFFGPYLVNEYKKISRLLADHNVKVVFTGHYHSNDIAMKKWNDGSVLYDVETGSLVTYPCPIRKVQIQGDTMKIETMRIRSIPSNRINFQEYARKYVEEGVTGIAEQTLLDMNLRPGDAEKLGSQVGMAFSAHCAGDEVPRDPPLDMKGVNLKGRIIISFRKKLVRGMYNDPPPSDNTLVINLRTGTCQ